MSVLLYDALKSSYGNNESKKNIENAGYQFDNDLSSDNQQVFYNQNENKLMFNVAGTHNIKDWGTDLYLGLGLLKSTDRYKDASNTLEKAKEKYHPNKTVVSGHSLGSTIGSYIAGKDDDFYGLDGGYTIGQPTRGGDNRHNYRSAGDGVSLLSEGATHMKTLINPNHSSGIGLLDLYKAHDVSNIKKEKIFL